MGYTYNANPYGRLTCKKRFERGTPSDFDENFEMTPKRYERAQRALGRYQGPQAPVTRRFGCRRHPFWFTLNISSFTHMTRVFYAFSHYNECIWAPRPTKWAQWPQATPATSFGCRRHTNDSPVGSLAAGHSCYVVWVPQAHKRLCTAVTSLISTNEHQFRVSTIMGPLWAPLPTFTDTSDPNTCPFVFNHQKRRIFATVNVPVGNSSFWH